MHQNVLAVVSAETTRNVPKLIGGRIHSRQYPEKYCEWPNPVSMPHDVHEASSAVLPFSVDKERIVPRVFAGELIFTLPVTCLARQTDISLSVSRPPYFDYIHTCIRDISIPPHILYAHLYVI